MNTQVRLLIQMGPTPSPKAAFVKEVTTAVTMIQSVSLYLQLYYQLLTILRSQPIILINKINQLTSLTTGKPSMETCHSGIIDVPSIVTYSTPCVVVTDLHTSFHLISTTNQPDGPLSTSYKQQLQYYYKLREEHKETDSFGVWGVEYTVDYKILAPHIS